MVNLSFSNFGKGKNKETGKGRCAVWDRCSLQVQKNSRFGLRSMLLKNIDFESGTLKLK